MTDCSCDQKKCCTYTKYAPINILLAHHQEYTRDELKCNLHSLSLQVIPHSHNFKQGTSQTLLPFLHHHKLIIKLAHLCLM